MTRELTRRDLLGIAGAAGSVALAGCGGVLGDKRGVPGTDGTATDRDDDSGSDIPEGVPEAVHTWLTEAGNGANIYSDEPAAEDMTGEDSVTIANGAGQGFAFDPPVVVVSTGTEVTWEWTGAGGAHNVSTDYSIGSFESDFDFRSGAPQQGSDVTYSHTFEEAGNGTYVCEPHASAGMMGAIIVQE
ncbi:MAG: halocyanin-like protein [Natronomonas sp.]|jgi:halocyanin-like protein